MDNQLKEIKKEMGEIISPSAFFTEKDRQKVRSKIEMINTSNNRTTRKAFPEMLTAIAACLFLVLIGGIIGKESGMFESSTEQKSGTATEQLQFDPTMINKGDILQDLQVGTVSYTAKSFPKSPFHVQFNGKITLTGQLEYVESTSESFPGEIIFHPDQEGIKKLPIPNGTNRIPVIYFDNFPTNKEEIIQFSQLREGEEGTATITLESYHLVYTTSGENVDSATLLQINNETLSVVEEDHTGVVNERNEDFTVIPYTLTPLYGKYREQWDQSLLVKSNPEEIFLMFWQAVNDGDPGTMYSLFHPSANSIPEYQSFLENIYEQKTVKISLMEQVKEMENRNVKVNKNTAKISMGEHVYQLEKDSNGVWKVVYFLE